ncbi:hypothetical protein D3C76_1491930 [compost metagenome]
MSISDSVAQQEKYRRPQGYCRQPFNDKQPLPACVTRYAVEVLQDKTRDKSAEHARDGQGCDEHGRHHPASMAGEPGGEIEDDAGKESRLGNTNQQTQCVEG